MQAGLRLGDIYRQGRFALSIEVFPPKTSDGDESLRRTLRELSPFQPQFVSCTYGAGGSSSKRTIEWCAEIQSQHHLTSTAHFTCIGSSAESALDWLGCAWESGVRNIMALRGDIPGDRSAYQPVPNGLKYANELVALIRSRFPGMGIGVAGYPEKHPEAPSADADFENLIRKVKAGADAIFTQLFFDNDTFCRFRDRVRSAGVDVPVVPGIMPITEFSRIQRITAMCGSVIPQGLATRLEAVQHDKQAQYRIGVDYAISQIQDLIKRGTPGLHLYILNRSDAGTEILRALNLTGAAQKAVEPIIAG